MAREESGASSLDRNTDRQKANDGEIHTTDPTKRPAKSNQIIKTTHEIDDNSGGFPDAPSLHSQLIKQAKQRTDKQNKTNLNVAALKRR